MPDLFPWEPPAWIDRSAWDAFVRMRKAKGSRAPFTEDARDRAVVVLDRLRSMGNPPSEVLWQSVLNGWSGLFPINQQQYEAPKTHRTGAIEEIRAHQSKPETAEQRESARRALEMARQAVRRA